MAVERNFDNRTLYHGDNLDFLRGMNSGTVNLIATDPPFNKNRDFHATPDSLAAGAQFQDRWSWHTDIHDEWLIAIQRDEPEVWAAIDAAKKVYGDDMGAFLCWLGVRLLEMHRILTDDGSLYLHIDHTAHAWVKCLLDAIFGRQNFRNEIVWQRMSGTKSTANRFFTQHDSLLYYVKSENSTWNRELEPLTDEEIEASWFKYTDADGRRYKVNDLTSPSKTSGYEYEFLGAVRRWRYPLDKMNELLAEGQIHHKSCTPGAGNSVAVRKRYLDELKGRPLGSVWVDIKALNRTNIERTGYPTQKPLALYERIIKASSNPDDMVLDPFCGCATTPIAAERLGRQWVGMDIWDGAHQMVLDRLEKENLAVKGGHQGKGQQKLTFGEITYSTTPPKRTDSGESAALVLRTPTAQMAQRFPAPRTQHEKLLIDLGACCQGCGADYSFDKRVLEVDHINPRSQGGTDAYENLTLLCPPCNKEKRDRYTLVGLQAHNRAHRWMKDESKIWQGRSGGKLRGSARRRHR